MATEEKTDKLPIHVDIDITTTSTSANSVFEIASTKLSKEIQEAVERASHKKKN